MSENIFKNIGISVLFAFIFVYVLILNYSYIGIAIAFVSLGLILLAALVYRKDDCAVEKTDIYLLIGFVGITALHYQKLLGNVSSSVLSDSALHFGRTNLFANVQFYAFLIGVVLYIVFSKIAKNRESSAANIIFKFTALFILMLAVSVILKAYLYVKDILVFFAIMLVMGIIANARVIQNNEINDMRRPKWLAVIISLLYIAITVLVPSFKLSSYSLNAFLSITVWACSGTLPMRR